MYFLTQINVFCWPEFDGGLTQNKRMNEYNGISATKIVQIYKHTFFKILLTG